MRHSRSFMVQSTVVQIHVNFFLDTYNANTLKIENEFEMKQQGLVNTG